MQPLVPYPATALRRYRRTLSPAVRVEEQKSKIPHAWLVSIDILRPPRVSCLLELLSPQAQVHISLVPNFCFQTCNRLLGETYLKERILGRGLPAVRALQRSGYKRSMPMFRHTDGVVPRHDVTDRHTLQREQRISQHAGTQTRNGAYLLFTSPVLHAPCLNQVFCGYGSILLISAVSSLVRVLFFFTPRPPLFLPPSPVSY